MFLAIGLGTPGEKYLKSRHNAGFILLDGIIGDNWTDDKYAKALISHADVEAREVMFVKPLTFMNNSGESVKFLRDKYVVPTENIIVIHDDIDMPFGSLKIIFERGDGGHNGVKSTINQLNTNKFVRIKVGIAPVGTDGMAQKPRGGFFTTPQKAVARYVLKDFGKADLEKLKSVAPRVKEMIETIIREGYLVAMNKFN